MSFFSKRKPCGPYAHLTDRQLLEKMMAKLTDVQAALDGLKTDVSNSFQQLTTDLTQTLTDLGATPGQIQGLVDGVGNVKNAFDGAVSGLDDAIKAADPGA